jgi:hypothetical protein
MAVLQNKTVARWQMPVEPLELDSVMASTPDRVPQVSDAAHWAQYPTQPRSVQSRMQAAERLHRLAEVAKAS